MRSKDESIRSPAVAGTFYPDNESELRKMISGYLKNAKVKKHEGKLRGIIVPHAGYIYSGPVAAYGYCLLESADIPKKILMVGPSHFGMFPGLAESGFTEWLTPLGPVRTYSVLNKNNEDILHSYPAAHTPEHSLEVQLPFLQTVLKGKTFAVDPILTGDLDPCSGSDFIEKYAKDDFLIVSSDLSHYLPYDLAVNRDKLTIKSITSLDLDALLGRGDACGKAGIAIAVSLAKKNGWKIDLLHYANSGDTAGPKTGVVGYAAMAIYED